MEAFLMPILLGSYFAYYGTLLFQFEGFFFQKLQSLKLKIALSVH